MRDQTRDTAVRASAQYPEVVPDTAPQVVAPSYPEAVPPSSPLPTYHRNGWDSDKVPIIYHDSNLQAVQHTYNDLYALSPTPDPADNAPESAHPWSSKAGAGNTVCGLRRKWFWTGLVVLLVIGAAVVAAAVGATVAHRHNNKAARTRAGHNASAGDHDETTSAPLKDVNLTSSLAVLATSDGSLIKRFSQNVTSGALVESIYSSGAWKSYQLNTAGQQTPLSVIGWPRISLDTMRLYYISSDGYLEEAGYASNNWTSGSPVCGDNRVTPANFSRITAVRVPSTGHISVFYQNAENDVVEYRQANASSKWTQAATLAKGFQGAGLAAVVTNNTARLYYAAQNTTIVEYIFGGDSWNAGTAWNGTLVDNTALSATAWYDPTGGEKIRLFSRTNSKSTLWFGYSDPTHAFKSVPAIDVHPDSSFAAVASGGSGNSLTLTCFYQNSTLGMMQDVYHAGEGTWAAEFIPPS